jgi:hypothetical protein
MYVYCSHQEFANRHGTGRIGGISGTHATIYISSVGPPAVAAPSTISYNHQVRLVIHGTGFTDNPNVVDGVFGNGTVSSATNPIFSIANLSAELWLPADCDEEGPLMLLTQPTGGGALRRSATRSRTPRAGQGRPLVVSGVSWLALSHCRRV